MMQYSNDPIKDSNRQEVLSGFREQIIDMSQNGHSQDIVNGIIYDVSAEEIGCYLHSLINNQSTGLKSPLLTEAPIEEIRTFREVCQRLVINGVEYYEGAKIYFLESEEFGVVIIPINIINNRTCLFMQPIESAPPFIYNLWARTRGASSEPIDIFHIPGVSRGFPAR